MKALINIYNGRINRITYLLSIIPALILLFYPLLLVNAFYNSPYLKILSDLELPIYFLNILYTSVFAVKRLHDIGQPGWIQLFVIIVVPFLGFQGPLPLLLLFFYSIYLLVMPGQNKTNQWGVQPSQFGKKDVSHTLGVG